ncbi:hypothetical protein F5888DRAFT_1729184, partial [Russula emetica]
FGILLSPIIVLLLLSSVRSCAGVPRPGALCLRGNTASLPCGVDTPMRSRAFSKRHRDESHGDGPPWNATSTKCRPNESGAAITHHKPAARIPEKRIRHETKGAGCGADWLVAQNSQAVFRLPLPGPRFPQRWEKEDAEGVAKLDAGRMVLSSKGKTRGGTERERVKRVD